MTVTSTFEDYTTDEPRNQTVTPRHNVTPSHAVTPDVKTMPVTVLQSFKNSASIPLTSHTMNISNTADSMHLSKPSSMSINSNRAPATMATNVMGVSMPATSYHGQTDSVASMPSHNKFNPEYRSVSMATNLKNSLVSSEVVTDRSDIPVDMSTISVEDSVCTRNTEIDSEQKLTDAVILQVKDIAIATDAQYESNTYPVSTEEALAALKEAESILKNDGGCTDVGNQELNSQV